MPRRNRPKPDGNPPLDEERLRRGVGAVQTAGDGEWIVRLVPGGGATKAYRCPGCGQEIQAGTAHVVGWPADERGDLSDRRHWHTGCWRARDRRQPGVLRSRSAPRYG